MADSSSLPALDISHEQTSISTPTATAENGQATPTPAIEDDQDAAALAGGSSSGASEWQAYIRGRKRKWSAVGIEQKHMDDLEGLTLGLVVLNSLTDEHELTDRYHMAMMQDQLDVLYPPTPTAFASTEDALRRLLPYHIYQVHDSELEGQASSSSVKQAQRAKEDADLSQRINSVHERVFKLKRREGTHPSALPSLISLIQSSTENIRQETAAVQAQYKQVKGVWDTVEAEQKERERARAAAIAQANALRAPPPPAPKPTPIAAPATAPPRPPAPAAASAPAPAPAVRPTPPVVSTPTTDTSELLPKVSRGRGRPPGSKTTPRPAGTPAAAQTNGTTPANAITSQARPPPANSIPPQSTKVAIPPKVGTAVSSLSTPGPANAPVAKSNAIPNASASRPVIATPGPSSAATPAARPPNGAATASGTASGESGYKKDALPTTPSTLRMTVKQLPQLVSLGIVTLPRDPKVKTPGYVSQVSANKEIVTVVVTLAECSHIQLTTLAKMLGVAAKPAEGTGAAKPVEGSAKPAEASTQPANGTASPAGGGAGTPGVAPAKKE